MGKNGDGVADSAGWLNAGVQAVSARATTARDFAARAIRMGVDYSIVAKERQRKCLQPIKGDEKVSEIP
jgi:hypothetical protein